MLLFYNIWQTKSRTELAKLCLKFMNTDLGVITWPKYVRELAEQYNITDPEECLRQEPPEQQEWSAYVERKINDFHEMEIKRKLNNANSGEYLNLNADHSCCSGGSCLRHSSGSVMLYCSANSLTYFGHVMTPRSVFMNFRHSFASSVLDFVCQIL